ncbi:hypothetical protein KY289_005125 [Solanum tuberosum]|nr:hypothetical protein KY289_005125 [Solanum tuberosum]
MNLACGAMLVLLTGSRNGFADFGVGREVVVVADFGVGREAVVAVDLQSLAGVHGCCSSELEPKTPRQ